MDNANPFNTNIFLVASFSLANPAAGANFSYPVPANTRMEILGVTLTLINDANVGNRLVQIHGYDGTAAFQYGEASGVQVASATAYYSAAPNGGNLHTAATDSIYCITLPSPFILNYGDSLRSTICSIQAGDQISAIRIRAKVWISPS